MEHIHKAIQEHGETVWKTAMRLLSNREDALDCYQQTFLEALEMSPSNVRSWKAVLTRIVTSRSLDRLRHRYRQRSRVQQLEHDPPTQDSPDQEILDAELIEHLRRVLANLPEMQSQAFWMLHLEKLSANQIGEQLNIEPGNVRVIVHRAMVEVRKQLAGTWAPISNITPTTEGNFHE